MHVASPPPRTRGAGISRLLTGARDGLRRAGEDSLTRNSLMIALATASTTVLGYGYWVAAANLFPADSVGIGSALVSAFSLVSMVAIMGGQSGLVQRLPQRRDGREWSTTVTALLLMGTVISVLGSLVTLVLLPLVDPAQQLFAQPLNVVLFTLAVIGTTVSTLTDYVWVAERRGVIMMVFNVVFALGKLGLLVGLARSDGSTAIMLSWTAACLVATVCSLAVMARVKGYRPVLAGTWTELKLLRGSLAGHHVMNLAIVSPTLALPVVAATRMTPADAAYLYAAWRIGGFFVLVASSFGSALFAEGSHDRATVMAKARRSARMLVPVFVVLILGVIFFRDLALEMFGDDYRVAASTALLLLAIAAVPEATLSVGSAILRVQGRLRLAATLLTTTALAEIVIGGWVMPSYGVTGAAAVALGAQVVGALVLLLFLRRAVDVPVDPGTSSDITAEAVAQAATYLSGAPMAAVPDHSPDAAAVAVEPMRASVHGPRRDLDPHGPTVSVVVPAMNEARNLPWLAARMPGNVHEIILVDGRSVDDTVAVAQRLWPHVRVVNQHRKGKGNALACGFAAVTGDITVMIDADGSMDPGEIVPFVEALVAGADYAKGSRFARGGGSSDITRIRMAGNKFLNGITNTAYRSRYTDLCYGYNAFWTRVATSFQLDAGTPDDDPTEKRWGDGFEIETLINIRVHVAGHSVVEVASYESDRLHGVSNLNAVSDGLRVLRTIAIERRRRKAGLAPAASAEAVATAAALAAPDALVPEIAQPEDVVIDLTVAEIPLDNDAVAEALETEALVQEVLVHDILTHEVYDPAGRETPSPQP